MQTEYSRNVNKIEKNKLNNLTKILFSSAPHPLPILLNQPTQNKNKITHRYNKKQHPNSNQNKTKRKNLPKINNAHVLFMPDKKPYYISIINVLVFVCVCCDLLYIILVLCVFCCSTVPNVREDGPNDRIFSCTLVIVVAT